MHLNDGDRIVILGSLAVRPFHYAGHVGQEGAEVAYGPQRPIEGLRIRLGDRATRPIHHPSTGIYGFLDYPHRPSPVEALAEDPRGRYLACQAEVDIQDRTGERTAFEASDRPAPAVVADKADLYLHLAMRPSPAAGVERHTTAVWGRLVDADGRPVPFARLELVTQFRSSGPNPARPGVYVTYSDRNGDYVIVLPGEHRDASGDADAKQGIFDRILTVHRIAPGSARAHALARGDWRRAIPTAEDLEPDAVLGDQFERVTFNARRRDSDGDELRTAAAPSTPPIQVKAGESRRWDVELLP